MPKPSLPKIVPASVVHKGVKVHCTLLFWLAFVFTRPLGATLGDLLTKPLAHGGLSFGRITSSLVIAIFIFGCILFTSQRAGDHGGESGSAKSN
jgi:uncharacterized membrane-anchored protein